MQAQSVCRCNCAAQEDRAIIVIQNKIYSSLLYACIALM